MRTTRRDPLHRLRWARKRLEAIARRAEERLRAAASDPSAPSTVTIRDQMTDDALAVLDDIWPHLAALTPEQIGEFRRLLLRAHGEREHGENEIEERVAIRRTVEAMLIEAAELEAEETVGEPPIVSKGARGPVRRPGSLKDLERRTGIDRKTIRETREHMEAADTRRSSPCIPSRELLCALHRH